jgi:putative ABC transport system permease protein
MTRSTGLPLPLRLALRELRGGIRGFRLFLACLALGVGAIAAVGSVSSALIAGVSEDARALLGGDAEVTLVQRRAEPEERAFLDLSGRVSEIVEMRAMAERPDADGRTLVELKGVDELYPLVGTIGLASSVRLADALAEIGGRFGAAIELGLADRLGIGVGNRLKIGAVEFEVRALIEREPDRATGAFSFGPRVFASRAALEATGLILPGSLIRYHYRVELPAGIRPAEFRDAVNRAFPAAGWRIRTYDEAAPGLRRFIDRVTQYLVLVGLTALLVGGVGVGNAVRSYLERKLTTVAILKCVGASGGLAFRTYFALVGFLAAAGISLGLLVGAVAPVLLASVLSRVMPVAPKIGIFPAPLAMAAAAGALTTLVFALWPLARAAEVKPAGLFRAVVAPPTRRPPSYAVIGSVGAMLALAALVLATSQDRFLALWFLAGCVGAVILFQGLAHGMMALARRAGRPRRPMVRLALANLYRPGAPTAAIALSLGLGLTVFVAIALIEANLNKQVNDRIPERAPSFFFIDVQPDQVAAFDRLIGSIAGVSDLKRTPMVRGRISKVAGVSADRVNPPPGVAWALQGDRGLSYAAEPPDGAKLVAGSWWPADYRGKPLVSMDANIARGLGLDLGDVLTLNVLGRDIDVEIASLREIDWGSLAMNFTFIFAPGTLEAAPHTHIATAHAADRAAETALLKAIGREFPNVSAIRVKDALDAANRILESIGVAVRLTAAVTLIAGTLVLAGAIAAGHHHRVRDAVVLKVLGARRRDVLGGFLLEYGILGLAIAAIAAAVGSFAGHAILIWVMRTDSAFYPAAVAGSALSSLIITLLFGLIGTWWALSQKAAPMLRNE